MKTAAEKIEKICFNCGAFFPASFEMPDEYGVCLNDPEFDPFVDGILEQQDYASCQGLVDRKKFNGERAACSEFDPVDNLEIEDDTPLGRDLKRLMDAGKLNTETFKQAMFEDQIRNIDWAAMPVDRQMAELKSPKTQARAIASLGGMIALGNLEAFKVLSEFLKGLRPPTTIQRVHFRRDILRHLRLSREKETLLPFLVDELYRIPSNNTTRQWISDILEFMGYLTFEQVSVPLERMIEDKRFSYKLKQKMKYLLAQLMEDR